jgi:hypothetical protein
MNLPAPIEVYFEANARLDAAAMLTPFADDAVVRDERHTHEGADAIQAWIERTSIGLPAIAVARAIRSEGESHHVTAQVSGDFAGSPVTLSFRFRLNGDRIAELDIT